MGSKSKRRNHSYVKKNGQKPVGGVDNSVVKHHKTSSDRTAYQKLHRNKVLITWSTIILALLLATIIVISIIPKPSPYIKFAKCLTESNAVMYGTDWCSHCQDQKRLFGEAFKEIDFKNCDYSHICKEVGVTGYPTWILGDGTRLEGEQSLSTLAEKTGCSLK